MQLTIEIKVKIDDNVIQKRHIVADIDLDYTMPPRSMITHPHDMVEIQQAAERRRRLVDSLAGGLAQEITEAMFKAVK